MPAKKEKKPMAQGIGESRIFAAPDGSFAPAEINIEECHVAGILVADLPAENRLRLLYQQTDEGMIWWEENRHRLENRDGQAPSSGRGNRLADGSRATDEEDKKLLKYRDARVQEDYTDFDGLRLANDPFSEPMRKHTPPGHRGLFMSEKQCKEHGMVRGVLSYEPVLVKGADGRMERVTVGGMFLASVPEHLAKKAERYYETLSAERQVTTQEKVRAQSDQVMAEGGLRDIAKRKRVLDDLGGLETEDSGMADAELVHQFVNE